MLAPAEIHLELRPTSRLDVIDVSQIIRGQSGTLLDRYQKALYYSYHTTAGYLEQPLCARLHYNRDSLKAFVQAIHKLFPPNAKYQHDQLHLREELSEEQRRSEPRNADSHLTFMGSGLTNCVTYKNSPHNPVYFIDLDGVYDNTQRRRLTTVIAFNRERTVESFTVPIPVSGHPIDSINLKDERLDLFPRLLERLEHQQIERGRVEISLCPQERHAALTVNEYETLLMKHDLAEVLRNPFRFAAEKGIHMLSDPMAIPGKALNYAKYDLVQLVNEFLDVLGLSESVLEKIIDKFLAFPASRFLWMKRSVSLLVSQTELWQRGPILEGTHQSPILVQWKKGEQPIRRLQVTLSRFE